MPRFAHSFQALVARMSLCCYLGFFCVYVCACYVLLLVLYTHNWADVEQEKFTL